MPNRPLTDERKLDPTDPASERNARRAARADARATAPAEAPAAPPAAAAPGVMIPNRRKRLPLEAPLMRVIATAGIVAIGVVIGAIMTSQDVAGWIIGLVVSGVTVILAALLWSSRRL